MLARAEAVTAGRRSALGRAPPSQGRALIEHVAAGQKARKDDGERVDVAVRLQMTAPFTGGSCVRLERLFPRPGLPPEGRSARRLSNARQRHRSHAQAW